MVLVWYNVQHGETYQYWLDVEANVWYFKNAARVSFSEMSVDTVLLIAKDISTHYKNGRDGVTYIEYCL